MYSIAFSNLYLRNCNTDNLLCNSFFKVKVNDLGSKGFSVGMINPPYSQGSAKNPELYEINFILRMMDCLAPGGRGIAIVPQSTMFGNSKAESKTKRLLLERHTLEGVITLNNQTFFGVGVNPCICVFTAGEPHTKDKLVKFIDFSDDGYVVELKQGLVASRSAKEKKKHLLQIWNEEIEDDSMCAKCTVGPNDDWIYDAQKKIQLDLTDNLFAPYVKNLMNTIQS